MRVLSASQSAEMLGHAGSKKNAVSLFFRLKHFSFLIASLLLLPAICSAASTSTCDPTILYSTTNMWVSEAQTLRVKSGQANWSISQYPQPVDPNNPTPSEYLAMTQGDGSRGKLTNPDGSPITGSTFQVIYTATSSTVGVCTNREARIVTSCGANGSMTMNVSTSRGTTGTWADYSVQQKFLCSATAAGAPYPTNWYLEAYTNCGTLTTKVYPINATPYCYRIADSTYAQWCSSVPGYGDVYGYGCWYYDQPVNTSCCAKPEPGPNNIAGLADPKNLGNFDCPVGNPINQGTGNKYQVEMDYIGSGPFPLAIKRYFNGDPQVQRTSLGFNWRTEFDRSIFLAQGATTATAYRPDGKLFKFQLSNGNWTGDADVTDHLQQTATGWTYSTSDDVVETYNITILSVS